MEHFNAFLKRAGYPPLSAPAESRDRGDIERKLSGLERDFADYLKPDLPTDPPPAVEAETEGEETEEDSHDAE